MGRILEGDIRALPASQARSVDRACERHEHAWRSGTRPRIEEAMCEEPEGIRAALFAELLALELELRRGCDEAPRPQEYLARFPEWSRLIDVVFNQADPDDSRADPDGASRVCGATDAPAGSAAVRWPVGDAGTTVAFDPDGLEAPPPLVLREVGDYELLEEIGRGGMGVVYKARQKSLDRLVALKMILAGQFASPDELHRFRNEARLAARLDDPHIVPIYQVGEHEGLPYLSMKLVLGGSLASKLDGTPMPAPRAVELIESLARAIHHAHRVGLVHRDLKPGNILQSSDGRYLIADFGLAKSLDGSEALTRTDQIMGTPSYMAPEQAWGLSREITRAADIYALGAILYELLTGRPPFRAASASETLEQVRTEEPAPPRLLNPRIDPELQTICLKCLEKEPHDRYDTAEELAEDMCRYRRGEPIEARSYNVIARIKKTLQKRSYKETDFQAWGTKLILFAAIVFAGHMATFFSIRTGQPPWVDWTCRAGQLVLGTLVLFANRQHRFLPSNAAERQLWSIWIGYLIAYATGAIVNRLLVSTQVIARGPRGPDRWEMLVHYPTSAVLSGLAFFIMGNGYWGLYYALGGTFFVLAMLMPLSLTWAPIAFGTLWAVSLLAIGFHLRRPAQ